MTSSSFATDLYAQIAEGSPDQNVIISPLSVQSCLAMAFLGASGKTAEEMVRGLHLESADRAAVAKTFGRLLSSYDSGALVKVANKIYVKNGYGLKKEYNELVTAAFHSTAENINFDDAAASANTINQWVEKATNDKITNLIKEDMIDSRTRLILLNAIHFKGTWKTQFDAQRTRKADFYLNDNDVAQVDMMSVKAKFAYAELPDLDAKALALPYQNSDLYMLVLLPNSRTGLKALELQLKSRNLAQLAEQLSEETVHVKLPKFKTEFSVEMNEPLQKMGLGTMFSSAATFDNMLDSDEPLQVSKVVHKAFIEVNEEGTEAAAATGMIMMMRCAMVFEDLYFEADHPFLYAIIDKEALLFQGRFIK